MLRSKQAIITREREQEKERAMKQKAVHKGEEIH